MLRCAPEGAAAPREAQLFTRDVTIGQIRAPWLSPAMIERLSAGDAEVRVELEELAQYPDDSRPFSDPVYWGGFICQGDPSPLPAPHPAPRA